MSVFVVEGPRGAGKTTFCNELIHGAQLIGMTAEIWKAQRDETNDPNMSPVIGMRNTFAKQLANEDPDHVYIWDRCHLTEFVMSTHLNRVWPPILYENTIQISQFLKANGIPCLLLMAEDEVILRRVNARTDGRTMDMPIELVQPLWRVAYGMCSATHLSPNNNKNQMQDNVALALSKIIKSRGQNVVDYLINQK